MCLLPTSFLLDTLYGIYKLKNNEYLNRIKIYALQSVNLLLSYTLSYTYLYLILFIFIEFSAVSKI